MILFQCDRHVMVFIVYIYVCPIPESRQIASDEIANKMHRHVNLQH
jgi:hypothetical protein